MESANNNRVQNGNALSVDRNHLYTSAALQGRIIQDLNAGRHYARAPEGLNQQYVQVQSRIADVGLNPVNKKANRAKMDPIYTDEAPAESMARNIQSAAYHGQLDDLGTIGQQTRAKREKSGDQASAQAFLFDDNNLRQFKNTFIDYSSRDRDGARPRRRLSPEDRGVGQPSQPLQADPAGERGHAKSSERVIEGFYHEDRRPVRSLGVVGTRHAPTYAYKKRAKHLGEPNDYVQHNYEKRIRQLQENKVTKTHMSSRVMETWINDTLRDAGHLDIPGVILKPESATPLNRYGIDKNQLLNGEISQEGIDRIYRALFVYSLGFYEMLNKALKNSPEKNSFQNALWKVFSILLEYCCKTNYQMLVKSIQADHREELKEQEREFNEYQERMDENEKKLKLESGDLKRENDLLEKKLDDELQYSKKLREDMAYQTKNHEEEVQLRLQFESKLNSLHALHRDVKAKYSRAAEDIYQLETLNKEKSDEIVKQKAELIELRSLKIEHESAIANQGEKVKHLQTELEIKIKNISENENKIIHLTEVIDKKDYKIKDMDQVFNTLRLKNEAAQATINSLEGEKQHLQLSLKENRTLKDQYYEKSETIQQKYQELFEKLNLIQKDVVAIDEIKRDRDERLNQLREELDELSKKYDELSKDHSSLSVKYEHTKDELDKLRIDYDRLVENLNKANKIRQETEEALDKKTKEYDLMVQKHEDALKSVEQLRKDTDKLNSRLQDSEKAFDTLQIKKESLEKQNEIQRSQLNDKIRNLEQLLSAEKDARERWIDRYEQEQKLHVTTNTELLRMRSMHQDADMNLKNSQINLESVTEARKNLGEAHDALQIELSNVKAKNENLERELYSKTELLKNVEEQQRFYVRRLKEDYQKVQKQIQVRVHEQQMLFEDLRSFMVKKHEYAQELVQQIEDLQDEKAKLQEKLKNREKTIEYKDNEIEAHKKQYEELKEEMHDLRVANAVKDNELIIANKKIQELHDVIKEKEKELERIPQLQKELEEQEMLKDEIQRKLDDANLQLGQMRGDKVDATVQAGEPLEDKEVQTEEDFSQVPPTAMNFDQMNMFQNQNMNQLYQRSDTESLKMMPGGPYGQPGPLGSLSQGGLGQPQMLHNNLNFSQQNIRQSIKLTGGKNQRIQSAINTAPSTGFIGSQKVGGMYHPNMNMGASTAGISGIQNSNTDINMVHSLKNTGLQNTIKTRTIAPGEMPPREPGSKSAGENRYRGQLSGGPQLQTFNQAMGQEMLIDESQYQHQLMQRPTTGGVPGYGGFRGQSLNTSGQTMSHAGAAQSQVAPHALFNHQAASKKSFRIRGQAEQEMMKREASASVKDIGMMDFNNDILKSVYELRKSHAALVNRPISSQPFTGNRRNIQSAVARQPQQMAFGGFMIPAGGELNMATSGEGFLLSETNQILEIDELQSERGKKSKSKTEKPKTGRAPRPRPSGLAQIKSTGGPLQSHPMTVGIQVSPGAGTKPSAPETSTPAAGPQINVSSHHHLQFPNQDMSMSGKSLHNLTGMYGLRSQPDGLTVTGATSQGDIGPHSKQKQRNNELQSRGTIKKLIKLASSND